MSLTLFFSSSCISGQRRGLWSAPVNHAVRYLSVRINFAISGSFRSFDRFCCAQPNKVCDQASLICSVKLQYIFIRSLVAWGTVNSRFDAPMELVSDELGNFASELGMSHAVLVRRFFLFDHGNTVFCRLWVSDQVSIEMMNLTFNDLTAMWRICIRNCHPLGSEMNAGGISMGRLNRQSTEKRTIGPTGLLIFKQENGEFRNVIAAQFRLKIESLLLDSLCKLK